MKFSSGVQFTGVVMVVGIDLSQYFAIESHFKIELYLKGL
jgi:hypothetical protein